MGDHRWQARGSASQTIAPAYLCDGVWNSAHWCNEEYDRLVREFDGELDEQRREELAVRAATLQQEETPTIIAYWTKELRAVRKNFQGLAKDPNIVLDMSPVWLSGCASDLLGYGAATAGGPWAGSC